jgi:hypothetical protein
MARSDQPRRDKFFRDHPFCCFCGGHAPAVEEDHFPSKSLFRGRHWPEGYVFPACEACNHVTEREEQLVAWLSRARIRDETMSPGDLAEFQRLTNAIDRHYPGLRTEMVVRTTHRERRQVRDRLGINLPPGASLLDIPILNVESPRIQDAVLSFGRKFGLALYYRNFERPMPLSGGIGVRWFSNIQIDAGEVPASLQALMTTFPKLERSRTDLSDQFNYSIGLAQDGELRMGIFSAGFHTSFSVLGYFTNLRSQLPPELDDRAEVGRIFSPFSWSS